MYLVQDTSTSELLALKKIHCPFGAESVAQAMKEVDAYRLFERSPGIIHSVGYSIAADRGSGGDASKTVYVLLPYYRRGNLQDMINANLVNHARFPERRLMLLFLGVCRALRQMHRYGDAAGPAPAGAEAAEAAAAAGGTAGERMELPRMDGVDENVEVAKGRGGRGRDKKTPARETGADEDNEREQQQPLMHDNEAGAAAAAREVRSYAHRDIKPG